ncbi:hypothetical protein V8D89_015191, partial [Ganoderma adspersum]
MLPPAHDLFMNTVAAVLAGLSNRHVGDVVRILFPIRLLISRTSNILVFLQAARMETFVRVSLHGMEMTAGRRAHRFEEYVHGMPASEAISKRAAGRWSSWRWRPRCAGSRPWQTLWRGMQLGSNIHRTQADITDICGTGLMRGSREGWQTKITLARAGGSLKVQGCGARTGSLWQGTYARDGGQWTVSRRRYTDEQWSRDGRSDDGRGWHRRPGSLMCARSSSRLARTGWEGIRMGPRTHHARARQAMTGMSGGLR